MIGALLAIGALVSAEGVCVPDLEPTTYRSPSGRVTLFVDPSKPSGAGPATYCCERDGRELWSGPRPFTLREALVTDDGLVAGYGFAAGSAGGADDALWVVLLGPNGEARLEERSKREGMLSCMSEPDPWVVGLFLDSENDRFVVRIRAQDVHEAWWTYSLPWGEPGARLDPSTGDDRVDPIQEVIPVPTTGLLLVRHVWLDFGTDECGAVFRLLDPAAHCVWRLDWPDDYTVPGDREASEELFFRFMAGEVVLAVEPARFELRHVATKERLAFAVERAPGSREGWVVREVGRAPLANAK